MKRATFESDYAPGTTLFLLQTDDGDIIIKTKGEGEMRIATSGGKMHGRDLVDCVGGFAKAIDAINNAKTYENGVEEKPEEPKKWSAWSVLKKLEAYEETGLTPEDVARLKEAMQPITIQDMDRFQEIMRAEKAGRLEILPCEEVSLQQTIEESRALTAAINSLRLNPDLSDIEAQSYEIILANMRDRARGGKCGQ